MKKFLLLSTLLSAAISAYPDWTGAGYYRVENFATERWISIIDNKGSISIGTSSADTHAISLVSDQSEIVTDAGSVLYIKNMSSDYYEIEAQGTSIYQIIDHYLQLEEHGTSDGQKKYRAFGTIAGQKGYLADVGRFGNGELDIATDPDKPNAEWLILPILSTGANYFGVTPDINASGKNYTTLYSSFPYGAASASSGMKFYYIGRVDNGMAEMIEINGNVPAGSPVIIQCPGSRASENRLEVGVNASQLSGNSLSGVYFDLKDGGLNNYVAYDPNTMRVLGTCSDGTLGFVKANISIIPANTAYLKVPSGSPAELKCVSTQEFESYKPEEPEITELYVIGDFNGWSTPDKTSDYYILKKTSGNIYSGTVSYSQEGAFQFKVFDAKTNSYANSYGANSENWITLEENVPYLWTMTYGTNASNFRIENWGGGSGTITVDLDKNTLSIITDKIEYIPPVPVYPEYINIAGNFNSWNEKDTSFTLSQTNEEGIYEGSFNIPKSASSLEFKLLENYDWNVNYGGVSNELEFELYDDTVLVRQAIQNGGNWKCTNWAGGTLNISFSLIDNTIVISAPDQPNEEDTPPTPPDPPVIPDEDVIYLIGDMQGWDINASDYKLEPAGYKLYSGVFSINAADEIYFRFYSKLGDWETNSLGSSVEANINVPVIFESNDKYSSPFVDGKGNWILTNWGGGIITMQIDLLMQKIILSSPGADVAAIPLGSSWTISSGTLTIGGADYIRICDMQGKTVAVSANENVDISNLPKGIYIIRSSNLKPFKIVR